MKINNYLSDDTIAAIATPPGEGGIAVIRISGSNSLNIVKTIFMKNHRVGEDFFTSHKLVHGSIIEPDTGKKVDDVMCTYLKSPNTYTGEDTVEIYSHGGYIVPRKILDLLIRQGSRSAEAGEFTKRAYMNGKMDLSQAEAVANIIHAQTEYGLLHAENQLAGMLSDKVNSLKDNILDILAEIEAHVDFPEEDIEESIKSEIIGKSTNILNSVNQLIRSYNTGKIYKNGIKTAILGKPNVGKSSLLNQLLMEERAIVSPVAGTTRDFIEEIIDMNGIPLKITDTAGMRDTSDEVEMIGVNMTGRKAKEAEFLIIVIDGSSKLDNDDIEVLKCIGQKKCVLIINKSDLESRIDRDLLSDYSGNNPLVEISALKGEGIEELKEIITKTILETENTMADSSEIILTDARHKDCLEKCRIHLEKFLKLINEDESPEFLAIDLRFALDSLGEITGEITTEDLLGRIFSKFCVGK